MKKTICIFGALLLSLCILTSCSGGGGGAFSGIKNTFSGICHSWVLDVSPNIGMRFDSDGKLYDLVKVDGTWYELSDTVGSYIIDGSELTAKDSDGTTVTFTFSISGDTLTLSQNGVGMMLTKQSISPIPKKSTEI